ncbi:Cysteine and histidine-rich domain-containing protein RAR1, partial [Cucurbita argyrosperma subsp. sororia]
MTKTYAILRKKLEELERQVQLSRNNVHPSLLQDIHQKWLFIANLLSAEVASCPSKPRHLKHIARRLAQLEPAFRNCKAEDLVDHVDDVSTCSCTESCLNDDGDVASSCLDDEKEGGEFYECVENEKEEKEERKMVRVGTLWGAMASGCLIVVKFSCIRIVSEAMENQDARVRCQRIGCNATFTEDDNPEGSCQYHDSSEVMLASTVSQLVVVKPQPILPEGSKGLFKLLAAPFCISKDYVKILLYRTNSTVPIEFDPSLCPLLRASYCPLLPEIATDVAKTIKIGVVAHRDFERRVDCLVAQGCDIVDHPWDPWSLKGTFGTSKLMQVVLEIPLFHDGMKEWSCCKKRSHDFSLFLEIPGCKTGKHTTEKPVLTKPTTSVKKPSPAPVSSMTNTLGKESCARCRQGFFCSDHGSQVQGNNKYINQASNLPPASNIDSQVSPAPAKKTVGINEPQICKNKGCGKTFTEMDNHDTACSYHPGPAVFHDRLRGWKCCDVHHNYTTEADEEKYLWRSRYPHQAYIQNEAVCCFCISRSTLSIELLN